MGYDLNSRVTFVTWTNLPISVEGKWTSPALVLKNMGSDLRAVIAVARDMNGKHTHVFNPLFAPSHPALSHKL